MRVDVVRGLISLGASDRCGRDGSSSLGLSFGILGLAPVGGPCASPSVLGVSNCELEPAGLKAQEGVPELGSKQSGLGPLHRVEAMAEVLYGGTS